MVNLTEPWEQFTESLWAHGKYHGGIPFALILIVPLITSVQLNFFYIRAKRDFVRYELRTHKHYMTWFLELHII